MGRDKVRPKPLDVSAFHTLVKTASEVLRRHEQQRAAQLHRSVFVEAGADRIEVALDIHPDEDEPYAVLSALDAGGRAARARARAADLEADVGQRARLDRARLRQAALRARARPPAGRRVSGSA
jgi:hypothetical protein